MIDSYLDFYSIQQYAAVGTAAVIGVSVVFEIFHETWKRERELKRGDTMANREGYKDPTAETAIKNAAIKTCPFCGVPVKIDAFPDVSGQELTWKAVIVHKCDKYNMTLYVSAEGATKQETRERLRISWNERRGRS